MRKMLVAGALFSLLSLPTPSLAQQQDTFDYKGKSLGSDLTSNATRYSGNLETSAVLYRTGKSVEEYINRRTATGKDRAKDL